MTAGGAQSGSDRARGKQVGKNDLNRKSLGGKHSCCIMQTASNFIGDDKRGTLSQNREAYGGKRREGKTSASRGVGGPAPEACWREVLILLKKKLKQGRTRASIAKNSLWREPEVMGRDKAWWGIDNVSTEGKETKSQEQYRRQTTEQGQTGKCQKLETRSRG